MGRYITVDDVKIRLAGKVRFVEDPEQDQNAMPISLLSRLINEAEGQVEMDLSARYAAPFRCHDNGNFQRLPARPTKEVIRTLCELLAVIRVLETDFGRGTAVSGEKYRDKLEERYQKMHDNVMATREGGFMIWTYPPLPGLKLNYQNQADVGYQGQVIHTSVTGDGGFPALQINDPSESFFNFSGDDGDVV